MPLVFVLEDEPDLNNLLLKVLSERGFEVRGFIKAGQFLFTLQRQVPDLVILDLNLPDADGLEVARALMESPKTKDVRILMLTARTQEDQVVEGLRYGDDYVRKPFSLKELVARVEALLRREKPQFFEWGNFRVAGGEVFFEGKPLSLTPAEKAVLLELIKAQGEVVRRRKLLDAFGGQNPKSLDVIIARLRKKLGPSGSLIKSVKGEGYKLCGTS